MIKKKISNIVPVILKEKDSIKHLLGNVQLSELSNLNMKDLMSTFYKTVKHKIGSIRE